MKHNGNGVGALSPPLEVNTLQAENEQLRARIAELESKQYAEANRTTRYMSALRRTALRLMRHNEVDNLLNTIIEDINTLTDTEHAILYLEDKSHPGTVLARVATGMFSGISGRKMTNGTGVTAKAFYSGAPEIVTNYQQWEQRTTEVIDQTIYSALGLPLKINNDVIGVIGLAHTDANKHFNEDDLPLLQSFADIAAIAIHNARLTQKLMSSEAKFRDLIEKSPFGICVSENNQLTLLNNAYKNMIGYSLEELADLNQHTSMALTHTDRLAKQEILLDSLENGDTDEFKQVKRYIHKNGDIVWANVQVIPTDDDRKLIFAEDITEEKHTKQALTDSELRFRMIFDTAAVGITTFDADGQIIDVNPAFIKMLGYTREELADMDFSDYSHPDDLEKERAVLANIPEDTTHRAIIEKRYFSKNQSMIWARVIYTLFPEGKRRGVAIIEDITEQKFAELAVIESEARFRILMETVPAIVFLYREGDLLYINPAAERMIDLSGVGTFTKRIDSVLKGAPSTGEIYHDIQIDTADGKTYWLDLWLSEIDLQGLPTILGTALDVSSRKHAIKHQLAFEAEQKRVDVLAEFVAHASHDFRTPLSTITTSLYLVERLDNFEQRKERINIIKRQVNILNTMIDDMLTLTRLDSKAYFNPGKLDLDELLASVIEKATALCDTKGLQLNTNIMDHPPFIHADGVLLGQAITNVIDNAYRYTDANGTIDFTCTSDDRFVSITVQDSGIGISEEEQKHIFERFYRVDRARSTSGTGLGLPIVKKIVERHQGTILVDSTDGEGSCFTIQLPVNTESQ